MTGRLLIIGQDEMVRQIEPEFQELGLVIQTARDGLEGLRLGAEFIPDLVVTEILIDRLSGFEVASRIAEGNAGFSATVIFYSEFYRDEKARRQVLSKYGASQYFVRPFQKNALKHAVKGYFEELSKKDVPEKYEANAAIQDCSRETEVMAELSQRREGSLGGGSVSLTSDPESRSDLSATGEEFTHHQGWQQPIPNQQYQPDIGSEPRLENDIPMESDQSAGPRSGQTRSQNSSLPLKWMTVFDRRSRPVEFLRQASDLHWVHSTKFRTVILIFAVALGVYSLLDSPAGRQNRQPMSSMETHAGAEEQASTESLQPDSAQNRLPSSNSTAVSDRPVNKQDIQNTLAPAEVISLTEPESRRNSESQISSSSSSPEESLGTLEVKDVTGRSRAPAILQMRTPRSTDELLEFLGNKALVVRISIDREGRVQEVAPVNAEAGGLLPPDLLATIKQWKFARSNQDSGVAKARYFSFRAR